MGKLLKLKAVSLLEQALATTPYDVADISVHDVDGSCLVRTSLTISLAELDGAQERDVTDAIRGLKLHAQLSVQQPPSDVVVFDDVLTPERVEVEYNKTLTDTGDLELQIFPSSEGVQERDVGDLDMPQTKLVRRKVGSTTGRGRPKGAKNKPKGGVTKVNVQGGRDLPALDEVLQDDWDEVEIEEH